MRRISSLFGLAFVVSAQAWGPIGHRQIADIAWTKLTHSTKRAIARILMSGDTVTARGADQVFAVPSQEITDVFLEEKVRPVFAESANWCDVIKGGKSQHFEGRITADNAQSPGVHPPASGNAGEETRCKSWHYYDRAIVSKSDPNQHPARESNAVRALVLRTEELREQARHTNPDYPSEAYCLYWIEHLFGDLHQPLHCVSSFFSDPKGDEGGNGLKLGIPSPYSANQKWNLHGYWDSGIDHAIQSDPALTLSSTTAEVTRAWTSDPSFQPAEADAKNLDWISWIDSGWKLAQDVVYKGIKAGGVPRAAYQRQQALVCKRQAILAGYRLAEFLNRTFSSN